MQSLNQYLSDNNTQYNSIYQNPAKYIIKNSSTINDESNQTFFSNIKDLEWLKNHVNNLKIYKTTFETFSATAAVAAAGFWAAAWWFGISIPWAVGATIASTLISVAASSITIALVKYDQEMNRLAKAGSILGATFSLGHIFYSILNPIFAGLATSATAVSWAFPAVIVVVGIASAVLVWINLYK